MAPAAHLIDRVVRDHQCARRPPALAAAAALCEDRLPRGAAAVPQLAHRRVAVDFESRGVLLPAGVGRPKARLALVLDQALGGRVGWGQCAGGRRLSTQCEVKAVKCRHTAS